MTLDKYIIGIRNKDSKSYKIVYDLLARRMFAVSYRITNSVEDSKDVFQESFLKSFFEIDKLKNNSSYVSWLKRIIVNNSLQCLRKKSSVVFDLNEAIAIDEQDESWFENIPSDQIKTEIHKLPQGCRVVFCLYVFEELKHREIAEKLNVKISTSKSQYAYACKLLRNKLIKAFKE